MIERDESARKLLYKVAERIEREPENYWQDTWGIVRHYYNPYSYGSRCPVEGLEAVRELCGTRACIGGWAMLEHPDAELESGSIALASRVSANGQYLGIINWATGKMEPDTFRIRQALGLSPEEHELFNMSWRPANGDVPDTLRKIADGAHVSEVTARDCTEEGGIGRTTPWVVPGPELSTRHEHREPQR